MRDTYDENDRQVLENRVYGNAEILLSYSLANVRSRLNITHQTLGSCVNDSDEQEADREPRFRVLCVELPKRNDAYLFDRCNA